MREDARRPLERVLFALPGSMTLLSALIYATPEGRAVGRREVTV